MIETSFYDTIVHIAFIRKRVVIFGPIFFDDAVVGINCWCFWSYAVRSVIFLVISTGCRRLLRLRDSNISKYWRCQGCLFSSVTVFDCTKTILQWPVILPPIWLMYRRFFLHGVSVLISRLTRTPSSNTCIFWALLARLFWFCCSAADADFGAFAISIPIWSSGAVRGLVDDNNDFAREAKCARRSSLDAFGGSLLTAKHSGVVFNVACALSLKT